MIVFINVILKTSAGISLIICYLDVWTLTGYCAVTGSSWRRVHIYKKIKDTFNTKSGACSDKKNNRKAQIGPQYCLKIKSDYVVGFHMGQ